jgi:hypothetical protein
MSTELTNFSQALRGRRPVDDAYGDIIRPDEATKTGEYQKNTEGMRKPLLPAMALPFPKQIM